MSDEDNLYTVYQNVATDDFVSLIGKIPEPRNLIYSHKNGHYIRRSLSKKCKLSFKSAFATVAEFDEIVDCQKDGSVCCFSLNEDSEIRLACENLCKFTGCKKYLIVMPLISMYCQEIVTKYPQKINLLEFHLEICPLESDNFIIPSEDCFDKCFAKGDISDIYEIARAFLKLELLNGVPSRVFTFGDISYKVNNLLEEMKSQIGKTFLNTEPQFHEMIILDRTVDLITPLLTQFFYAGVIDDKYGTDYGYLTLPDGLTLNKKDKKYEEVLLADRKDKIFAEIKEMSIYNANERIDELTKEISEIENKMKDSTGTRQWNVYAKRAQKLGELKPYLELHLDLLVKLLNINRYMKPMMNYEYNLLLQEETEDNLQTRLINSEFNLDAIRLMCLNSVISNGLSQKVISDFQNILINKFGSNVIQDINNLKRAGLLVANSSFFDKQKQPKFSTINNEFKLVVDSSLVTDEVEGTSRHTDIEAGYDSYVPLLLRIIQFSLDNQLNNETPISKLLNQMKINYHIYGEEWVRKVSNNGYEPKRVLVFIIGGITATEILLLRQMGKIIFNGSVEFHIGSTNIINSKRLLKSLCPTISKSMSN